MEQWRGLRGREAYLRIAILGLTREAPGEGGDESRGFPPAWVEGKDSRDTREAQTTGADTGGDVGVGEFCDGNSGTSDTLHAGIMGKYEAKKESQSGVVALAL